MFGAPGTGKTEFARALANRVGATATFAGLADEKGNEPDRRDRLAHLAILRALCRKRSDRIVVVDEADDILAPRHPKYASKQWVNLLVEHPGVPTIWIVNDPRELDPAILRRMTLAVSFDRPPLPVRQRIVRRAAQMKNLELADAEIERLASLPANAAIYASGLEAARLSGGGSEVAARVIASTVRAMGQSLCPEGVEGPAYDPSLCSADADLPALLGQLEAARSNNWSLLLSGPSGTGKSAFARHLADRLGIVVDQVRGSDLLGAYVGETESRIAEAFERAADRGAMLLIDEVDSFLQRRAAAQRSWEVTLVNQMLQQMDHLRAPLVATTNLIDQLDPAAQRRFVFRLEFKPITTTQAASLFKASFGQDWPPSEPVSSGHTPGDFAVVMRRATLLRETNPRTLVRWLREEVEARGQAEASVGFFLPEPMLKSATRRIELQSSGQQLAAEHT